jgi:hypothetical protein
MRKSVRGGQPVYKARQNRYRREIHAVAAWEKSDLIAAISAACAIAVFAFGIWQYRSSENWKRSEFVAAQIKDFNSDKINQAVLTMMDYDPAHIELFPDKSRVEDRYEDVNFTTLVKSINEEDFSEDKAGRLEFQVRQYFEHFITSLARINYFVVSGAIEPEELCADFGYYVDLMTGDAREMKLKNTGLDIAPFTEAIRAYLTRWQDIDITKFMKKIHKACK